MKRCIGCEESLPLESFHRCARAKDGLSWYCRACTATFRRKSYLRHRDKNLAVNARWRERNRQKMRALVIAWKERNPERFKFLVKRAKAAPLYRLHGSVATRVRDSLRGKKLGRGVESIIGYTIAELAAHLERQFANGMSWDNYGKWHIDHIVPLSTFGADLTSAWALSNLRPLWATENVRKSVTRTHLL